MKPISLLCALLLLAAAVLALFLGANSSYLSVVNKNWGLSLPEQGIFTEIYAKDSGAGFHGDGLRYHVFSCGEPNQAAQLLPWLPYPTAQAAIFHPTLREAVDSWLDDLEIPESERPDYVACQLFYAAQPDNSELLILWDNGLQRLYVAESFL